GTTAGRGHAAPPSAYGHWPDRGWEGAGDMPAGATAAGCRDIAQQLLDCAPGAGRRVARGGGLGRFLPAGDGAGATPGQRRDGRDLTREWLARNPGGVVVRNTAQLRAAAGAEAILGLFASGHLPYHHDRDR